MKSPNSFLQNRRTISPKRRCIIAKNHRTRFRQNSRTRFCQIAEHVFSKASNTFLPTHQCISPHVLSKNAEHFTPNLQRDFADQRAAYFLSCSLQRRPSSRSLPTRATGSALCVMGGRLWFLGHAYPSYKSMGFALDVMDYGPAKTESSAWN